MKKIVHWSSTVLLCIFLLLFVIIYIYKHDAAVVVFEALGFPGWLVYPLAIAKSGAIIILLSKFERRITEWTYAGVFFNLFIGLGAHIASEDGQALPAIIGILLLLTSYFTWERYKKEITKDS